MMIDENGDGLLSPAELRALVLGIQFEEIDMDIEDAVDKVLKEFDTSCDSFIDIDEFVKGISKWLNEVRRTAEGQATSIHLHHFHEASMFLIASMYDPFIIGYILWGDIFKRICSKPGKNIICWGVRVVILGRP